MKIKKYSCFTNTTKKENVYWKLLLKTKTAYKVTF